jgi:hypothetical protein
LGGDFLRELLADIECVDDDVVSGVREQLAMKITGHKTNSVYRRYRIVDEDELREAQEHQQAFLKNLATAKEGCPTQNRDVIDVHTDSRRCSKGSFRGYDEFRAFTRHASG